RAKLRATMFTATRARALELDEDRFAVSPEPNVPPIDLRIARITRPDQRAESFGIADGPGQRVVLDRVERGEEHAGLHGLQEASPTVIPPSAWGAARAARCQTCARARCPRRRARGRGPRSAAGGRPRGRC